MEEIYSQCSRHFVQRDCTARCGQQLPALLEKYMFVKPVRLLSFYGHGLGNTTNAQQVANMLKAPYIQLDLAGAKDGAWYHSLNEVVQCCYQQQHLRAPTVVLDGNLSISKVKHITMRLPKCHIQVCVPQEDGNELELLMLSS